MTIKVYKNNDVMMNVADFVEGLCGIHLSSYVESPFQDRGGLMVVAPAGGLKSTMLDTLETNYHNALSLSNSYAKTLTKLAPSFYNSQVRSLIFPDIQSVYAGDPRTAGRIEQTIMQLSAEATRTISGDQDARWSRFQGRCTIFAAMTVDFHNQHILQWEQSGFQRRFLWASYALANPDILMEAIQYWVRAEMGTLRFPKLPTSGSIKDSLTFEERGIIKDWIRYQPGPHELQFQLLCKATSALRWWYKVNQSTRDAMETMAGFSKCLGRQAALLVFPDQHFEIGDINKAIIDNHNHSTRSHQKERRTNQTRIGKRKNGKKTS